MNSIINALIPIFLVDRVSESRRILSRSRRQKTAWEFGSLLEKMETFRCLCNDANFKVMDRYVIREFTKPYQFAKHRRILGITWKKNVTDFVELTTETKLYSAQILTHICTCFLHAYIRMQPKLPVSRRKWCRNLFITRFVSYARNFIAFWRGCVRKRVIWKNVSPRERDYYFFVPRLFFARLPYSPFIRAGIRNFETIISRHPDIVSGQKYVANFGTLEKRIIARALREECEQRSAAKQRGRDFSTKSLSRVAVIIRSRMQNNKGLDIFSVPYKTMKLAPQFPSSSSRTASPSALLLSFYKNEPLNRGFFRSIRYIFSLHFLSILPVHNVKRKYTMEQKIHIVSQSRDYLCPALCISSSVSRGRILPIFPLSSRYLRDPSFYFYSRRVIDIPCFFFINKKSRSPVSFSFTVAPPKEIPFFVLCSLRYEKIWTNFHRRATRALLHVIMKRTYIYFAHEYTWQREKWNKPPRSIVKRGFKQFFTFFLLTARSKAPTSATTLVAQLLSLRTIDKSVSLNQTFPDYYYQPSASC